MADKFKKEHEWSDVEEEYLKKSYPDMSIDFIEICAKLFELNHYTHSRTPAAVRAKAYLLGLKRDRKQVTKRYSQEIDLFNKKIAFRQAEKKKEVSTFTQEFFNKRDSIQR